MLMTTVLVANINIHRHSNLGILKGNLPYFCEHLTSSSEEEHFWNLVYVCFQYVPECIDWRCLCPSLLSMQWLALLLSGYKVMYDGPDREMTCDQLQPGFAYRVRVSCFSSGGHSDVSTTATHCVGNLANNCTWRFWARTNFGVE